MSVPTVRIPALHPAGGTRGLIPLAGQYRTMLLGRKHQPRGKRLLRLGDYLDRGALSVPPPTVDWSPAAARSLGEVYGNDQQGDCVFAQCYHHMGLWSANAAQHGGPGELVSDAAEVLRTYHEYTGPHDDGAVMSDTFDEWMRVGLPVRGVRHMLAGYLSIDPTDSTQWMIAQHLFGAVAVGLQYLDVWQPHSVPGGVWDDVPGSSLGGHDVAGVGYTARGLTVATWGFTVTLTAAAMRNGSIVQEAYVLLGREWYQPDKLTPAGIAADDLVADLAAWRAGHLPADPPANVPPAPVPPAPPVPPSPPAPGATYRVDLTGSLKTLFGSESITMTGSAVPRPQAAQEWSDQECEALGIPPAKRAQFREQMRQRGIEQPGGGGVQQQPEQDGQRSGHGKLGSVNWWAVIAAVLQAIVAALGQQQQAPASGPNPGRSELR